MDIGVGPMDEVGGGGLWPWPCTWPTPLAPLWPPPWPPPRTMAGPVGCVAAVCVAAGCGAAEVTTGLTDAMLEARLAAMLGPGPINGEGAGGALWGIEGMWE